MMCLVPERALRHDATEAGYDDARSNQRSLRGTCTNMYLPIAATTPSGYTPSAAVSFA